MREDILMAEKKDLEAKFFKEKNAHDHLQQEVLKLETNFAENKRLQTERKEFYEKYN
jgi:hypothetical protein